MFTVVGSTEKFTVVSTMHDGYGGKCVIGLSMDRDNVRIKADLNTIVWLNAD